MSIYVVGVFRIYDDDDDDVYPAPRKRVWGWYSQYQLAEQNVLRNVDNMFVGARYNYAVIEEVPEGIIPMTEVRQWFKATVQNSKVVVAPCDPPRYAARKCGFTMG